MALRNGHVKVGGWLCRGQLLQVDRSSVHSSAPLHEAVKRSRLDDNIPPIAVRRRRERDILKRATEPNMHLAQERVHCAQIARCLRKNVDPVRRHMKYPWLAV